MSEIIKEKNLLLFITPEEKKYTFDTSTGILYGLSGKPLHSCPAIVNHLLNEQGERFNSSCLMTYGKSWKGVKYWEMNDDFWKSAFNLVERLESIGYHLTGRDCDRILYDDYVPFFTENFKGFAKYFRERNQNCYLGEYRQYLKRRTFFEDNKIRLDEHFTEEMGIFLFENQGVFNNAQRVQAGAYFLSRGLWSYYSENHSELWRRFDHYFMYCESLGWELKTKGGFMELYVRAKETYQLRKTEIDNQNLAKHQNHFAKYLAFEYGNFEVVIPKTSEEFADEAEQQDNCVYRLYLPRCIQGLTNVVFIRKKDNKEKSYITCEVSNNGDIVQFLRAYNHSIREPEDIAFYEAYKNHLESVWNK